MNFDDKIERVKTSSVYDEIYTLPDYNEFTLSEERFRCCELLFNPSLNHLEFDGIHKLIFNSINKCSSLCQNELYSNIVLCGGSTKFEGFSDRLEKEINKLDNNYHKKKFVSMTNPEYSAWIGGSMLVSEQYFNYDMLRSYQYFDSGPSILHYKFI